MNLECVLYKRVSAAAFPSTLDLEKGLKGFRRFDVAKSRRT